VADSGPCTFCAYSAALCRDRLGGIAAPFAARRRFSGRASLHGV